MEFIPTTNHKEIDIANGLLYLQEHEGTKLYSDGLEENEYIYYESGKGFCYEDHCVIGRTLSKTLQVLRSLKWCFYHKFYIDNKNEEKNEH